MGHPSLENPPRHVAWWSHAHDRRDRAPHRARTGGPNAPASATRSGRDRRLGLARRQRHAGWTARIAVLAHPGPTRTLAPPGTRSCRTRSAPDRPHPATKQPARRFFLCPSMPKGRNRTMAPRTRRAPSPRHHRTRRLAAATLAIPLLSALRRGRQGPGLRQDRRAIANSVDKLQQAADNAVDRPAEGRAGPRRHRHEPEEAQRQDATTPSSPRPSTRRTTASRPSARTSTTTRPPTSSRRRRGR